MKHIENRPILITGIHRSGTTWVSRILSYENKLATVNELFNMAPKNKKYYIFNIPLQYWNQYIDNHNSYRFDKGINNLLNYNIDYLNAFKETSSPKDFLKIL